jgi:hypothetical protein
MWWWKNPRRLFILFFSFFFLFWRFFELCPSVLSPLNCILNNTEATYDSRLRSSQLALKKIFLLPVPWQIYPKWTSHNADGQSRSWHCVTALSPSQPSHVAVAIRDNATELDQLWPCYDGDLKQNEGLTRDHDV